MKRITLKKRQGFSVSSWKTCFSKLAKQCGNIDGFEQNAQFFQTFDLSSSDLALEIYPADRDHFEGYSK
jgi:hypothetical protein